MTITSILQKLTGVKEIKAKNAYFSNKSLIFEVEPYKKHQNRCPICNRKCPKYDNGKGIKLWRTMDFGMQEKIYLEANAPRITCKIHGIKTASVPWARTGSRFTKRMEDTIAWLATQGSKKMVSELARIEWHTVGDICSRVYEDLRKRNDSSFDDLTHIGIDETSYKKGHKYMTVVVDHNTSKVVWCEIGYGKDILEKFFVNLSQEQRDKIQCVTADGARWITECVEKYCKNATRCVDPFHVISWATTALDEVRRKAWHKAHLEVKEAVKRPIGRPSKGEVVNPEKKEASSIKNMRYFLLKNKENLTIYQKDQVELLTKANPKLYRAYLLKESLRSVIKCNSCDIAEALNKWITWAERCRITEFRNLCKKIKRHKNAIIAASEFHISNARIEATNNKIKLIIRKSYGFRNTQNLISMVMLTCSNIFLQPY